MEEILSVALVEKYIDSLVTSFTAQDPVSEKALSILFNANLYGECIREVKLKMKLDCALGVYHYEDVKFPVSGAAAYISIPKVMPFYGSASFQKLSLRLCLKKSLRKNYHSFVYCIAHEMSHVVLHSTSHPLRHSEIATDLFVIVSGFGEIMQKGRYGYGYLDDFHFYYAISYLNKKLGRTTVVQETKTASSFWDDLKKKFNLPWW